MKTRSRMRIPGGPAVFHTKEEYVADYLREGILSGRFPRGTRLKQADLATDLGLSITPVREALRLLAAEGYVLGMTHRGALVAPFDVGAAAEIVELRALLETRLTVSAMQRMTLAEMEQLQLLAQEFEDAVEQRDASGARGANYRFHRYLFSLADEPQTRQFVQVLWAKYPFDLINALEGRTGRAAREHAQIIDAITSRNVDLAVDATRKHVLVGWDELRAALATNPSLGQASVMDQAA